MGERLHGRPSVILRMESIQVLWSAVGHIECIAAKLDEGLFLHSMFLSRNRSACP